MDISLIETLRWEPGAGFVRLERHLARLMRSAADLGLSGADGARDALIAALPPSCPAGYLASAHPSRTFRRRPDRRADGSVHAARARRDHGA
jgi:4-amino-4-deoxychorismate lyase